jgi:hypothetical protein
VKKKGIIWEDTEKEEEEDSGKTQINREVWLLA